MSLRRIGVLVTKELVNGPKNFIFIFAIVVPLVLSLVVSLLFGSLFSGKPVLGIADEGTSDLVTLANGVDSMIVKEYDSRQLLRDDVARGAVDVGIVLPTGFDSNVRANNETVISSYVWGQSLLKDRALLATTIAGLLRELAGQEPPVDIVSATVGAGESIPLNDRLLPFIVLMTVVIGATMVPATAIVNEKVKHTITAVTTTPASLGELYLAKGIMGVIVSLVMGIVILVLNQAFGSRPLLLIGLLTLGAALSATLGVLLGALLKDINSLFATIKAMGLLLYAPAFIYMFPQIPAWIGRVFPTYYIIAPVIEVVQKGAGLSQIADEVAILIGLIGLMIVVINLTIRRTYLQPA